MDLHPIRLVKFDRGGGQIQPVKLGGNPLRLHCLPAWQTIRPVEFDRALNSGQIGWKFTEITFVCLPVHSMPAWLNLVVIISMDLHPI